jgi:hypothetical protein
MSHVVGEPTGASVAICGRRNGRLGPPFVWLATRVHVLRFRPWRARPQSQRRVRPAVSRTSFSALSISRVVLIALRSAARAARAVNRSANAGSAALARNFSNATFLALAAASCRSMKSGCFKTSHRFSTLYFVLARAAVARRISCVQSRQRTRQPTTVASIGLLVSTLCQAPLLHRHKNGMT